MGTDYCPAVFSVFSQEKLEEMCPDELHFFKEVVSRYHLSPENLLDYFDYGETWSIHDTIIEEFPMDEDATDAYIDMCIKNLDEAWWKLCQKFEQVTMTNGECLTLFYGYRSEDDAVRGDTIVGEYFGVDGVYKRSSPGERFKDCISDAQYTSIG